MYVSRLPAQWRQLNRLQTNDHGKKGSSVQSLTCDADEHILTTVTCRDLFPEFSHENSGYFLEFRPAFVPFRYSGTM
jgi:hypothetical protein